MLKKNKYKKIYIIGDNKGVQETINKIISFAHETKIIKYKTNKNINKALAEIEIKTKD